MMLGSSSRPGNFSSQGARPRNMSSERRVRNRISPIHMKSGSAVNVHDEAVPQIVTAIASPAGRDEKSSIPIHATPNSASPIHTPLPSSTKSATMRSVVMMASMPIRSVCNLLVMQRLFGGSLRALSPPCEDQRVDERDKENETAQPHQDIGKQQLP